MANYNQLTKDDVSTLSNNFIVDAGYYNLQLIKVENTSDKPYLIWKSISGAQFYQYLHFFKKDGTKNNLLLNWIFKLGVDVISELPNLVGKTYKVYIDKTSFNDKERNEISLGIMENKKWINRDPIEVEDEDPFSYSKEELANQTSTTTTSTKPIVDLTQEIDDDNLPF